MYCSVLEIGSVWAHGWLKQGWLQVSMTLKVTVLGPYAITCSPANTDRAGLGGFVPPIPIPLQQPGIWEDHSIPEPFWFFTRFTLYMYYAG